MYQDGLRGDRYGPYDTTQREYEHSKQDGRRHKSKSKQKIEKVARGSYRPQKKSLEDEISESDQE